MNQRKPPGRSGAGAEDKDERVGYRRPPKATRFQPGISGNPKGRPKGVPNKATILERMMAMRVPVRIGDREAVASLPEALWCMVAEKALNGDLKAATVLLEAFDEIEAKQASPGAADLDPDDQAIVEAHERDVLERAKLLRGGDVSGGTGEGG
jgi:hypothetical protein